jgi:putative addiction module component (TIGR02574 family)
MTRLQAMPTLTREEIARLSPGERLRLIGDLWNSLEEADLPLSAPQRAELERRLADFEQDRTQSVTWEQLKAELGRRSP